MMRLFFKGQIFTRALILIMGIIVSTGCSVKTASQTGPRITKVNPYRLTATTNAGTAEQMIDFEHRRKMWGAVDCQDLKQRYGDYFTIFWKTDQPDTPATIKLFYRQANSGPKTFVQEKRIDSPRRTNTTIFEIVGDEFCKGGAVTQWKASIVQEGAVVDEFNSFLWQ